MILISFLVVEGQLHYIDKALTSNKVNEYRFWVTYKKPIIDAIEGVIYDFECTRRVPT